MESQNDFEIIDFIKFNTHKKLKEIKFNKTNCYIIPCNINKTNKKLSQQFVEGELIESNVKINLKLWLKDIKNSYNDHEQIVKQFLVDFDRCKFYCNGHLVSNPDSFIDYINLNCNKKQIKKILMLCSQTSFGLPYELIQNSLYDNSNQEYFLAEVSYNNKLYKHKYRIYFSLQNNNVSFIITKYLRIFKIVNTNDITVAIVKIYVKFNLENKNVILKILFKPYI